MTNLPTIPSGPPSTAPVPPADVAQTLFSIPADIINAFRNVGETVSAVRNFDWIGFGLVFTGLLFVVLAMAMIALDEGAREVLGSPAVTATVKAIAGSPQGAARDVAAAAKSSSSEGKETAAHAREFLKERGRA